MTTIEEQVKKLQDKFDFVEFVKRTENQGTIKIRNFELPNGWNKEVADIQFEVPVGFPCACPVDFLSDKELRLSSNLNPRNTQIEEFDGKKYLKFYWRVQKWSPNYDTLLTYARVIQNRFNQCK